MPSLPAICNNTNCGAVFASGFAVSGGGSMSITGCLSGPCPSCGGMGRVPDGKYSAIFNGINPVLSSTSDVSTLNNIYKALSESIKKKDFTSTKRELTKIAPGWRNIWGLLPENNMTTAIAVYSFALLLVQTAMAAHESFNEQTNGNTVIEYHHHYPMKESDSEKGKQDSRQQNQKFQLKPLTMAVKIALRAPNV